MSMFCYQCEQTAKGTGCTVSGVCGKAPETAALQDLVVHLVKGIARYAHRARKLGAQLSAGRCVFSELAFRPCFSVQRGSRARIVHIVSLACVRA